MAMGRPLKKMLHKGKCQENEDHDLGVPPMTQESKSVWDGLAWLKFAAAPRGWSCHEPFAHPLAKARHTEEWPDVVAVCSAGMVLVERVPWQIAVRSSHQFWDLENRPFLEMLRKKSWETLWVSQFWAAAVGFFPDLH